MTLDVTEAQIALLRKIRDRFIGSVELPARDFWRHATDDDVWRRVVSQVVVVGNAQPDRRLDEPDIWDPIRWEHIRRLSSEEASSEIWHTLRRIGALYAGKQRAGCRKTKALVRNLEVLKDYEGGPTGFIRHVAQIETGSSEMIKYVSERFGYIKNKGSRDFLLSGFGLITNHVALDTRVLAILRGIGLTVPATTPADGHVYDEIEQEIVQKICAPLEITGAQLDQMLFRNSRLIHAEFLTAGSTGPLATTAQDAQAWARGYEDAYAGRPIFSQTSEEEAYQSGWREGELLRLKHKREYKKRLAKATSSLKTKHGA